MNSKISHLSFDPSWAATPPPPPPEKPLHEILREGARKHPEKAALISLHHQLTYKDLDVMSDRLAAWLAAAGLEKGDRIATMLPNCTQHVIALYGILKMGGVVVPFNVMLKSDEVSYILEESGAKAVCCLDLLVPVVRPVAEKLGIEHVVAVHLKDFSEPSANIPQLLDNEKNIPDSALDFLKLVTKDQGMPPEPAIDCSSDLACILYTSGTTGFPKGAMITHANYNHVATFVVAGLGLHGGDVLYMLFPLFHVGGQALILYPAVLVGGTCVPIPMFDPGDMLDLMERFRMSFGFAPPTAYIGLLNHPDFSRYDLSSLRITAASGAMVPASLQKEWQERVGTYLFAGYGCTETTAAGPGAIELVNKKKPGSGTIGVITGEIKIVDEAGRVVPRGETGEFLLKGDGVVKGYWKKPDETARLFTGDGWWYSGDVGYMDEDGFLFFVERKKDLIVASGYNIAPAEVEGYLYHHPAVQEVAVIGVPDAYRGETVKAYVVIKEEFKAEVSEADILSFAREKMAVYKAPKLVEFIDELPKNMTGKVLRRALREREEGK
jgi:long-chain acyl-CoA synthetase